MSRIPCVSLIAVFFLTIILLSCGADGAMRNGLEPAAEAGGSLLTQAQWPTALPRDAAQPWEELDAQGNILAAQRRTSDADAGAVFAAGVERFDESPAGVSENLSAAHLESGLPGGRELSYVIYRLPLAGAAPGVVSIDANVLGMEDGATSSYSFGIANYSEGKWEWHGPFSTSHVILSTALAHDGTKYTSPLGNVFLCVVAFDGARLDVVGVSANPLQQMDGSAPAMPQGLHARQRAGALELDWDDVATADLAGYLVYYSPMAFSAYGAANVPVLPYILSRSDCVLPAASALHVRVSSVDISGNQSVLTGEVVAAPLDGAPLAVALATGAPSGSPGSAITLTASGAALYDWDLDGDGIYERLGDSTGQAQASTNLIGLLRPAVRGLNSSGTKAALAGVSILLETNSRPVASAWANPQSGQVPLDVTFTGEAEDAEDPLAALSIAWDFNGDGIFENTTGGLAPPVQTYRSVGIRNVKLRVEDTQGAWDVDTVAVETLPPDNLPPAAELSSPQPYGDIPVTITFDASGSEDLDGTIVTYQWDFDGDGLYEALSDGAIVTHKYSSAGVYQTKLRVVDDDGAMDTASMLVHANRPLPSTPGWPMFGRDAQHTHRAPYIGPVTNALRWKFRTDGPGFWFRDASMGADGVAYVITSNYMLVALNPDGSVKWVDTSVIYRVAPAIAEDGTLYAVSFDGMLYALSPDDSLLWVYDTGQSIQDSPAVGPDGTIFVSTSGGLYAVNPDGSPLWTCTAPGSILSSPAAGPDGTIYVARVKLYAINPNGSVKWSVYTGGSSSPVLAEDGTVIAGTSNSIVGFFPNGASKWTYNITRGIDSSPVVGRDLALYFNTSGSTLFAITTEGNFFWSYTTASPQISVPAVGPDGEVYVAGNDGSLYALDETGALDWDYIGSGGSTATPVTPGVAPDGSIAFPSNDMYVRAFDPDGNPLWTHGPGGPVESSPVVGTDGTVYFGCEDSNLYAINPDGSKQWAFYTWQRIMYDSPAIGEDGTIYIGSGDKLYARNPDGTDKWIYGTGGSGFAPTIGAGGTIYLEASNGFSDWMLALTPAGGLDWATQGDFRARSSPALGIDGTVYIGSLGGVSALDPAGTLLWSGGIGIIDSSPAVGTGATIYASEQSGGLFAINPDGSIGWGKRIGTNTIYSSPAIGADGTLYVGCIDHNCYAVNPDGSQKWAFATGGMVESSPSIGADGTVYVGSADRNLYAINPDGTLKWAFAAGKEILSSPAIGADGTVYFGSNDGYLYAIGPGGS